jgi:hypothetical protein
MAVMMDLPPRPVTLPEGDDEGHGYALDDPDIQAILAESEARSKDKYGKAQPAGRYWDWRNKEWVLDRLAQLEAWAAKHPEKMDAKRQGVLEAVRQEHHAAWMCMAARMAHEGIVERDNDLEYLSSSAHWGRETLRDVLRRMHKRGLVRYELVYGAAVKRQGEEEPRRKVVDRLWIWHSNPFTQEPAEGQAAPAEVIELLGVIEGEKDAKGRNGARPRGGRNARRHGKDGGEHGGHGGLQADLFGAEGREGGGEEGVLDILLG